MAARKTKESINLLPQEEFESSTLGRVLKWGLTTFRVIVIITEIVVVGAFLSRFWLDARVSDLNDLITQKEAVITASAEFEQEFKNTQNQLSIFSSLSNIDPKANQVLENVTSYLPGDTYLATFTYREDKATVKGVAPSERSVAQYIANLEASDDFGEITISQLGTSEEGVSQILFTLDIATGGGGES